MKKCPNCGDLYDDKNIFCSKCGAKLCDEKEDINDLVKICPVCGIEFDNDVVLCWKCGSKLIEVRNKNNLKDIQKKNKNNDWKPVHQYEKDDEPLEKGEEANKKNFIKCLVGILSVAMVLVIVLVFATSAVTKNIFKVSTVQAISIGATQEEVLSIIGKPYEDTKTIDQWEYYDRELLSYVEKYNKLIKDQEKALMDGNFDKLSKLERDINELSQKASSKSFGYIQIIFDERKVKSIYLNSAYKNTYEEKKVAYVNLLDIEIDDTKDVYGYDNINIYAQMLYEVFFVDGSYFKNDVYMMINIDVKNSIVKWSDKYGIYETKVSYLDQLI